MANERLEAAISLLLSDMEGEQGDRHEIWQRLHQILGTLRAEGLPLPDDLVRLERDLAAEFETEGGTAPEGEEQA